MNNNLYTIDMLNTAKSEQTGLSEIPGSFNALNKYLALQVGKTIKKAGSGHLGGSLSSVELFSTLYFGGHLRYSLEDPAHPARDRVLVRGHLGPLRYPLFSLLGWVDEKELDTYRKIGSRLHGHESMFDVPGVDITPSGSLGMLLSYGVGASLVSRNRQNKFKTYVFLGDGEEQEGNVSEAARHAANLGLDNLVCILDQNGKQLSRPTKDFNNKEDVAEIWSGYGWNVINIDGHNPIEINEALAQSRNQTSPTLIIAKTIKGHGLIGAEANFNGYHTISTCSTQTLDEFISRMQQELDQLGFDRDSIMTAIRKENNRAQQSVSPEKPPSLNKYSALDLSVAGANLNLEDSLASYYNKLVSQVKEQQLPDLYFLTADLVQTNHAEQYGLSGYKNYVDVGLREQHLVAMAHGISVTDPSARVHINGGDPFSFRSIDQLHAAGQGESRIIVVGEASGLSNSRNGPTHMSSSQPFAISRLPNTTFLEPCDVEDYYACLNRAFVDNNSVYYIRAHSFSTDILTKLDTDKGQFSPYYEVDSVVDKPDVTLIGSGVTTFYLWKAMDALRAKGIQAKLLNIVSPNEIDADFCGMIEPNKPCFCMYNGHPDFLPSIISQALLSNGAGAYPSLVHGHGFEIGATGTMDEMVKHLGFDVDSVVKKVENLLQKERTKYVVFNPLEPN